MKTIVRGEIIKRVTISTNDVISVSIYSSQSLLIRSKITGTFSDNTIEALEEAFDCPVKFYDNGTKDTIIVTTNVANAIAFAYELIKVNGDEPTQVSCGFKLNIIEIEEEEE